MGRPEKIIIEKRPDNNYRIICVDEMTNMCNALDIGENAYKALKHHFKTGAMEISSDEVSNCTIHGVVNPVCHICDTPYSYIYTKDHYQKECDC